MQTKHLPKLRSKSCTERITIAVDPELKEALYKLKQDDHVNVAEWVRTLIRDGIKGLKAS